MRLFIWFLLFALYFIFSQRKYTATWNNGNTTIFKFIFLFLYIYFSRITPFSNVFHLESYLFRLFSFCSLSKRKSILSLLLRVFWICLIFTLIYLIGGFLLGGFLSGRWNNVWLSTKGTPYLIYGDQLPLDEYFSSNIMLIRYLITSLLVFHLIGLFVVVCYLLSKNYIYSFIIISSAVILDKMLNIYFGFLSLMTHCH